MTLSYIQSLKRKVRTDGWDWQELGRSTWTKINERIRTGALEEAIELVDYLLPEGKRVHDLYCDWTYGMLTYVAEKYGEEEVYRIQRATADCVIGGAYQLIQSLSTAEYVALLAETMRSHRCGPGERGDLRIWEEEDRFVLSFNPCGSGGRMRRTGEIDGTPPRTAPPYNFGSTKKAYPWSWSETGVPYYCTHCCIMWEIIPIERLGYPLRINDYPDHPEQDCRWLIYKKRELIPEAYFMRVGHKK